MLMHVPCDRRTNLAWWSLFLQISYCWMPCIQKYSHFIDCSLPSSIQKKFLASLNNHEEACNMLCGKGRVRTQDLGYQSGALWTLLYTPNRVPYMLIINIRACPWGTGSGHQSGGRIYFFSSPIFPFKNACLVSVFSILHPYCAAIATITDDD